MANEQEGGTVTHRPLADLHADINSMGQYYRLVFIVGAGANHRRRRIHYN